MNNIEKFIVIVDHSIHVDHGRLRRRNLDRQN